MKFQLRDKEQRFEFERDYLSAFASKSAHAHATRLYEEEDDKFRTPFQRDRDRIIHSKAFRRLKHKRQVFFTDYGDHYRTRLTHTLEVSQLSRTVSRVLGLNEDLIEAVALGHDIGHTPFGHIGEEILNSVLKGEDTLEGLLHTGDCGGYKHNYQSLRVVDLLEKRYEFKGLNLTAQVREGILKHTRLKRNSISYPDLIEDGLYLEYDFATTVEGQIVAMCDEIAQRTHDLEDGIRSGFIKLNNIRDLRLIKRVEKKWDISQPAMTSEEVYINTLMRKLINILVEDLTAQTLRNIKAFYEEHSENGRVFKQLVAFSPNIDVEQEDLDLFIDKEIINNSEINKADAKSEHIIRNLLIVYVKRPLLLQNVVITDFLKEKFGAKIELRKMPKVEVLPYIEKMRDDGKFLRIVCDYLAGMSDNFALNEYSDLFSA